MSDKHTCLRCGGSAYQPFAPYCEHVTRASLRERLRGGVAASRTGGDTERLWWAGAPRVGGAVEAEHPTREGAISLVLDALVEREVERIREEPETLREEPPPASLTGWAQLVNALPRGSRVEAHELGKPCTCGSEDCPSPKPFEPGDVVASRVHPRADVTVVEDAKPVMSEKLAGGQWVTVWGRVGHSQVYRHATEAERREYEATR